MGSKKSSKSSSVSGSAQAWAKPFAQAGASQIAGTYSQYAPSTEDAVQGIGGLSDRMSGEYTAGQPGAQAGRDYFNDTISGKYLNANPYLDGMVNQMRGGVTDTVNSNFSKAGRYGSGAHQGVLGRELANAENQLRYNAYGAERGLQHQAAAGAQSGNAALGQLALGGYASQAAAPYAGMQAYGSSLGNLFSGGTQTSTQYSPNPLWGAFGSAMNAVSSAAAAGAFGSDRRLKRNIEKVGEFANGLGRYQWIYKSDPSNTVCEGVMADEVKDIAPEAYIADFDGRGHAGVDYAKLGIRMKVLA